MINQQRLDEFSMSYVRKLHTDMKAGQDPRIGAHPSSCDDIQPWKSGNLRVPDPEIPSTILLSLGHVKGLVLRAEGERMKGQRKLSLCLKSINVQKAKHKIREFYKIKKGIVRTSCKLQTIKQQAHHVGFRHLLVDQSKHHSIDTQ